MRIPALSVAAVLWGGAALAAPPAAPPVTPPQPPHEVSGVTVYGKTDAPKVTATYPAAGQALQAGVTILTVTFDQKMQPHGFDVSAAAGGEMPPCLKTPRLLDDGKTFALLCTTQAHKTYALAFNAQPAGGFVNVADHRAEAATLTFTTTDGDGPRSIGDALKAQNLPNRDLPIPVDPGPAGGRAAQTPAARR
jgi:hypothetical protein